LVLVFVGGADLGVGFGFAFAFFAVLAMAWCLMILKATKEYTYEYPLTAYFLKVFCTKARYNVMPD
jgi:hypothetical protein